MSLRTFSLLYGIVFLAVGILGFVPGITTPHEHPNMTVDAGMGALFGLFPVNFLHNLVHIAFGIWGIAASRGALSSMRGYAKSVAIVYLVLALMGVFPFLNTTFGLIPLYGHDIWLHAVLGAVAAYFGFVHSTDRATAATRA